MFCSEESLPLEILDESVDSDDEDRSIWTLQWKKEKSRIVCCEIFPWLFFVIMHLVQYTLYNHSTQCLEVNAFYLQEWNNVCYYFEICHYCWTLPLCLRTQLKKMTATIVMRIILATADDKIAITALDENAFLLLVASEILSWTYTSHNL